MRPLITHLSSIITIMALLALLSCHSKKELTASTTEVCDIEAAGSSLTATGERLQWMSNLALEIDSFEMFIPADHFAVNGKMAHDTVLMLQQMTTGVFTHGSATADAVGMPAGTFAAAQPRSGSVVLRARHASIGKSDKVERNSASIAQQADSMVAHRTMDNQQHTTSDNVQVAKPPDLTWLTWAIVGALIFIIAIILWLMDKEEENQHR